MFFPSSCPLLLFCDRLLLSDEGRKGEEKQLVFRTLLKSRCKILTGPPVDVATLFLVSKKEDLNFLDFGEVLNSQKTVLLTNLVLPKSLEA